MMNEALRWSWAVVAICLSAAETDSPELHAADKEAPTVIRSAKSGPWLAPGTWEGGKVPAAGARVMVRRGHAVLYDIKAAQPIRVSVRRIGRQGEGRVSACANGLSD
jgi:hypothetical protein